LIGMLRFSNAIIVVCIGVATVVLLVLAAVALGIGGQLAFHNTETRFGGGKASPNGQYRADLDYTIRRKAFQQDLTFYEFSIYEKSNLKKGPITEVRILCEQENPRYFRGGPPFDIIWDETSTSVATEVYGVKVILNTEKNSSQQQSNGNP